RPRRRWRRHVPGGVLCRQRPDRGGVLSRPPAGRGGRALGRARGLRHRHGHVRPLPPPGTLVLGGDARDRPRRRAPGACFLAVAGAALAARRIARAHRGDLWLPRAGSLPVAKAAAALSEGAAKLGRDDARARMNVGRGESEDAEAGADEQILSPVVADEPLTVIASV